MKYKKRLFPKNFLWGSSTASHQVEGNTYNQWTVWELENASRLAKTAKKRLDWLPIWDQIKQVAQSPNNYISGQGIEHYSRYKEDFQLAKKLNLNSFRFGIEWSRVEPEEGQWNNLAWQHYKDYIQELLDLNIEPILNLWHWTMPVWFINKGGFEKRKNVKYYERFIKKACEELQFDKLNYVITINEPNVYSSFSYGTGEFPPQRKNIYIMLKVYYNLAIAHKRSYKLIKSTNYKIQIGIANQLANVQSKRPQNIFDIIATHWMRYTWNWWFLNRIKKYQDFVGFNYYFTDYYRWGSWSQIIRGKLFYKVNPEVPKNDLGWYMEPEGLYPLLVRVWAHYKKPIMITESGLADQNDKFRKWWIDESIIAMEKAISEGVDVIGYMHWSLLDNFEWAYGWWPKFGLIDVDRKTMKRSIRKSAFFYANEIKKLS